MSTWDGIEDGAPNRKARQMSDRIAVCCGTPLIWTFMFSGSEWFCRECKRAIPMMNADRVESTPELEAAREQNEQWFREIAKDCIPRGGRLRDCDKCSAGETHLEHASDEDKQRSREAYAKLQA